MVAIVKKPLTFEEFLNWDDGSGRSFELVNGVAMPLSEPTAKHEDVVEGLCRLLIDHCQSLKLPYVPRQSKQVRLNSPPGENESSRKADIVVFAKDEWERMRQSSASAAAYIPPPLIIEVVSTNWRDDYRIKLNDYETLGVMEYWITDYAGLGGVQYIGSPKQPTLTINRLIDGEYQAQCYQGETSILSPTFPQLKLTVAQIVAMTEV
ncbi:Uma2 family endonuclease [Leptothermofonsia sichuanensis E412]|uniref:Uma2 family endonuclease n=1 Tax=Leptothermofonsia sichuanensis TaxID=2917832 RepID=UPI001CA7A6E2|nr:Uma2 family endonuclease [Leptothermofonsia sichuanensis]QZZ21193.1 Uma2 family endonuclease [Leptothermofonsia sichuanensis E412]